MVRTGKNIKRFPYLKSKGRVRRLQDRFDNRYDKKGRTGESSEGYLVPIVDGNQATSTVKNEPFVVVGNRRDTLPQSQPASYLGTDVSPSVPGIFKLGNYLNFWKELWVQRLIIRKTKTGPQASYNYDSWFTYSGHKLGGIKIVLEGYGAHAVHDGNMSTSIKIERPVFSDPNGVSFTFNKDISYTSIKTWTFKGWWSPTDVDNTTGIGIMRDCIDNASPTNPGVECEVADTGGDKYIYVRFRNFMPHRVVVGVRVVA